jgi:hypothetical protein
MTFDEIHAVLTAEFGLVPDLLEKGNGCSYFFGTVNRAPATTTRIIQVHHDSQKLVSQIKRSVSSDNNNNVFVKQPFTADGLRAEVAEEIKLYRQVRGLV